MVVTREQLLAGMSEAQRNDPNKIKKIDEYLARQGQNLKAGIAKQNNVTTSEDQSIDAYIINKKNQQSTAGLTGSIAGLDKGGQTGLAPSLNVIASGINSISGVSGEVASQYNAIATNNNQSSKPTGVAGTTTPVSPEGMDTITQPVTEQPQIETPQLQTITTPVLQTGTITNEQVMSYDAGMLSKAVQKGLVSKETMQYLAQTDPIKYQQVATAVAQQNQISAINNKGTDFIKEMNNINQIYNDKIEAIAGDDGREQYNKFLEDQNIGKIEDMLVTKTIELDHLDTQINDLYDNVSKRVGAGATTGYISAVANREAKELYDIRRDKLLEIQVLQGQRDTAYQQAENNYNMWKDNRNTELALFSDKLQRDYNISLQQYQMETGIMERELERLDQEAGRLEVQAGLQAQQQEEAQAQALQQQKDVMYNASMLSLYGGLSEDQKAMLIGLEPKQVESFLGAYNDLLTKAEEGKKKNLNFTRIGTDGDGNPIFGFVDMDTGEISQYTATQPQYSGYTPSGIGLNEALNIAISKCSDGAQCGKFVNDVLEASGYGRLVGNSYESKVTAIETLGKAENVNQIGAGSVFTYPVSGSPYGHIGMVTGVNSDGTINIMDYNYGNDEKQRELTNVDPNTIFNKGGVISKPIITNSLVALTYKEPKITFKTQSQETAYGFATRISDSKVILDSIETDKLMTRDRKEGARKLYWQKILPNFMESSWYQQYDQAKRNFVNAVLRRESGAVISDQEFANAEKQYFVMPGDSQEVIEQKRQNRDTVYKTMAVQSKNPDWFDWYDTNRNLTNPVIIPSEPIKVDANEGYSFETYLNNDISQFYQ